MRGHEDVVGMYRLEEVERCEYCSFCFKKVDNDVSRLPHVLRDMDSSAILLPARGWQKIAGRSGSNKPHDRISTYRSLHGQQIYANLLY